MMKKAINKSIMANKGRAKATDSSKVEVGEIDTNAPFQSVKDAVSMFGAVAFSRAKPAIKITKPQPAERVLAKETQFHLAQQELGKLKERLNDAEMTKAQALTELEKAKATVAGLTLKLKTVNELKESAMKATEDAHEQIQKLEEVNCNKPDGMIVVPSWKIDLQTAREHYMIAISEVNGVKQKIMKTRQDHDSCLGEKNDARKVEMEARNSARTNMERVGDVTNEISGVKASIEQERAASIKAHEEKENIYVAKNARKQAYQGKMEDFAKRIVDLKKDFDPELNKILEKQLTDMVTEISILQNKIKNAEASDLDAVSAKESLQKVTDEKFLLQDLLESLNLELENVKKEHLELKEKEAETESIFRNLNIKLQESKSKLDSCRTEHAKVKDVSDGMISSLDQLSFETENARRELKEMMEKAEELKKESEITCIALENAEITLKAALEATEEAKLAESKALDQITILSERTDAARSSVSESGAFIYITKEEMESLNRRVEESEKLSVMKVTEAMAQVEAVKASEDEAVRKLEATQKEIENMEAATQEALKRAELAVAAKLAVEGELRRRYEQVHSEAEAAARILVEAETSPENYQFYKEKPPEKIVENRKYSKAKSFPVKKTALPTFRAIFTKKNNQIEGGSPSIFPGE